jgi:cytochrome P450
MKMLKVDCEVSSPDYIRNTEDFLKDLVRGGHGIVEVTLQGGPVYIVADMAAAKAIFEDAKNFSFAPIGLSSEQGLSDGMKAYVEEGFESQLVSANYDDYRDLRKLMNKAFKYSHGDRVDAVDMAAKRHLASILGDSDSTEIDALALCRKYWLPLIADIIGVGSLSSSELVLLARSARQLNEGYGLQGDRDAMKALASAKEIVSGLIRKVVQADSAPAHSALRCFLNEVDAEVAIDLAQTFILGSIDTGSGVLALQTHLLAGNPDQCARFLAMSEAEQQDAVTELASKEAPVYYMPRFAVNDVDVLGIEIPAGSCLQVALHGLNSCANPDFDIARSSQGACPMHNNETIPFGHARHKCPGEAMARHLIPIFLNGVFSRFSVAAVKSFRKELNPFSRSVAELVLTLE